ncbi:MAG: alpha/beta hydrolase [Clostridiales bacterium]|nr:alpha/beta hydrolase [Clostridiales bacterium]
MIILVIVTALILILLLVVYCLYDYVFCQPLKRRPDMHCIPESNLYKKFRDRMLERVKEIEITPYEEVSILSLEGYRLYGKLFSMKEGAPIIIFFHGYHGVSEWDGYGFFQICKEHGINILMVDERAHGKSEGKVITFGIKERYDCKLWTEYAVKRFGEQTDIFLAGVSMGAATVVMASELGLPENVKGILSDCGYSEPAAILKANIKNMRLPVKTIYFLVSLGAKIYGHFDLEEMTSIRAVKDLTVPILFIHGKEDSIVSVSMSEELYEACGGSKERVVIEGADHANSAMSNYEVYEKTVMEFLHKYCAQGIEW